MTIIIEYVKYTEDTVCAQPIFGPMEQNISGLVTFIRSFIVSSLSLRHKMFFLSVSLYFSGMDFAATENPWESFAVYMQAEKFKFMP